MAQKTMVILQNPDTKETYYTRRNRKGDKADNKIEIKKYSKKLRKHVIFKEIKGHPKKKVVKAQKKAGASFKGSRGTDLSKDKSAKEKKKVVKKPVIKKKS